MVGNQLRLASHEKKRCKKIILYLALASFELFFSDISLIHSHSIPCVVLVKKSNPISKAN